MQSDTSVQTSHVHIPPFSVTKFDVEKLANLGVRYMSQFELSKNLAMLEIGAIVLKQAIEHITQGEPILPILLYKLGVGLAHKFEILGFMSDLNAAILDYSKAIELGPNHPDLTGWLNGFAQLLERRYDCCGTLNDLDDTILNLYKANDLLVNGHDKALLLSNLGNVLVKRFGRLDKSSDIDNAISSLSKAASLLPPKDHALTSILNNLGNAFRSRYDRYGKSKDLDEAMVNLSEAADSITADHPSQPIILNNLGTVYWKKFVKHGNLNDLNTAITTFSTALVSIPEQNKAALLYNLGSALRSRFESSNKLSDINSAICYQYQAASVTLDQNPDKSSRLYALGNSLWSRFQITGDIADVEAAISHQSKALHLIPTNHPKKPFILNGLNNALLARYDAQGKIQDLNESISNGLIAIASISDDNPERITMLSNLGNAFLAKYQRIGHIADLDAAIMNQCEAVKLTPAAHLALPDRLSNLGFGYHIRFQILGNTSDLDAAILHFSKAVNTASKDHPDTPVWMNNLGLSLHTKFEKLQQLDDINSAISILSDAVKFTPDKHPSLSKWLNNLGSAITTKSLFTQKQDDITDAVLSHTRAVKLTPQDHADMPQFLSNLSFALQTSYDIQKNIEDLNIAIKNYLKIVSLVSNKHLDKASHLLWLGEALERRFKELQNSEDLHLAIYYYSIGAQLIVGRPFTLFSCAVRWMNAANLCKPKHSSLMQSCTFLAWIGHSLQHQFEQLRNLPTAVADATAIAIQHQDYQKAVEWLEQGRSIIWKQMLQIRQSFDTLEDTYPELGQKLHHVARKLELDIVIFSQPATTIEKMNNTNQIKLEEIEQAHRRLAEQWKELLVQIRSKSGFEKFLLPQSFLKLAKSASDGPVVMLNASQYQCDALIILSPSVPVQHVFLPDISLEQLQRFHFFLRGSENSRFPLAGGSRHYKQGALSHKSYSLKYILSQIWLKVMKPIIVHLNLQKTNLIRVWLCPTGSFVSLPLHAAGIFEQESFMAMDYAIFSYTTCLENLLTLTPSLPSESFKFLAISQGFSSSFADVLPNATKEIQVIQNLVPSSSLISLENQAATVETILAYLPDIQWWHLACHGKQDNDSPLNSSFLLIDGNLTLEKILQQKLPNAQFAFLSACETATGDNGLPDEATHLAAGLMFAGFQSIIATLWSIHDKDGPIIAHSVYSHLFRKGNTSDVKNIAQALHLAVLELYSSSVSFERWVPFIHMGK
ncbi:hypothetical protein JAAARDRAFT_695220 [Jaapia argillacea MUCL 33604]|uniref:CHAT domain-containing protein n=1 Tax=Jaapia argillacea MUCL 33604 TaxID=933084 RepID=A0A067QBD8_9AGAM|nr:hypothetical protein JAAARDRAFT_695220 [Jaapia argillacea MUCL 33604]